MSSIRPLVAADAPHLVGLIDQLGYPSSPDAVVDRTARVLGTTTHQVLVAGPADRSRIEGYVQVERRVSLGQDDYAEITGLVVHSSARRTGLGRRLVEAAEQWASSRGLPTVVVRSNVVRPESHAFYEALGFHRTATSHRYRREVRPR